MEDMTTTQKPTLAEALATVGLTVADVDWTKADLSGADLTGANLSRADLTGANLSGANLSGANLGLVQWASEE